MFSELPKLFDRNFATAYFLPAALFLTGTGWLLKQLGYWSMISGLLTGIALLDTTLAVFIAWISGILLMILNREIIRILEGYGQYNPLRLLGEKSKQRFREKRALLKWLNKEYHKPSFTSELDIERTKLLEELAQKYPDKEELVLPTIFGNTVRAFEVYPRVMYGIEGIDGWSRILAVLPKEFRELIEGAKAQVDWWINLSVLSFCFVAEFWLCIFSKWGFNNPWQYTLMNILVPLGILILLNYIFIWRAISSAIGWGDYVKTAFDLFRFELLEALGIDIPKTRKEEREMWLRYSQAIVFRLPNLLPELKVPRIPKRRSLNPGRKVRMQAH